MRSKVLRSHGMPSALHEVFRAVVNDNGQLVIAKLCYVSSAWWGFFTAGDITMNNSLHPPQHTPRLLHYGPCRHREHTADHALFHQILTNPNHILAHLLPEKASTHYKLKLMQHDRQLNPKTTKLLYIAVTSSYLCSVQTVIIDCSFLLCYFYLLLYKLHFVSFIINEHDDDDVILCNASDQLTQLQHCTLRHVAIEDCGSILPVPARKPDPTHYPRAGRVRFSMGTGIPAFTREFLCCHCQ